MSKVMCICGKHTPHEHNTELRDKVLEWIATYNMDTTVGGMDEDKALDYQVQAIEAYIAEREVKIHKSYADLYNDDEADKLGVFPKKVEWCQVCNQRGYQHTCDQAIFAVSRLAQERLDHLSKKGKDE